MKSLIANVVNAIKTATSVVYTEKTHTGDETTAAKEAAVVFKSKGVIYRLTFVKESRRHFLETGFLTEEAIINGKTGKLVIAKKFNPEKEVFLTESTRKQYHVKLLSAIC